jgi:hypothetical protein
MSDPDDSDEQAKPRPPVLPPPPRTKADEAYAREKAKARAVGIDTEFIDGLTESLLGDDPVVPATPPTPDAGGSEATGASEDPDLGASASASGEAEPEVSEGARTRAMVRPLASSLVADDARDPDDEPSAGKGAVAAHDEPSDDSGHRGAVGAMGAAASPAVSGRAPSGLGTMHPGMFVIAGMLLVGLVLWVWPSNDSGVRDAARVVSADGSPRGQAGDGAAASAADGAAASAGREADEGDTAGGRASGGEGAVVRDDDDPSRGSGGRENEGEARDDRGQTDAAGDAPDSGEAGDAAVRDTDVAMLDDAVEIDDGGSEQADSSGDTRSAGGAAPLRGGSDPNASAEASMTAEELELAAKEALAQKRYRDAYRLAGRAYTKKKTETALAMRVHAACGMKNQDAAKRSFKDLPLGATRRELRNTCKDLGVRVGL